MYKIGELSRCVGLTVKTLRYWSEIGLLIPDEIDRFTGYRYYSTCRIAECSRIIALKELGFSLEEIKSFSDGDRAALITAKAGELEKAVSEMNAKLKRLRELRSGLEEGKNMFDIITRPAREMKNEARFRTVRKIFSDRSEALKALGKLRDSLPKHNVGQREIIVNYDTDYLETGLDLEIGVEVETGGKLIRFAQDDELIMTLVTKTSELEAAYSELIRRIGSDDCQITGAFCEILHDGGVVELKVPVCRLEDNVREPVEPLAFENDPEAVGRWKLIDIVPTREQFVCGHPKSSHDSWHDEFFMLEGGAGYWIYEGWTKGVIYTHSPVGTLAESYSIENADGKTLMFVLASECCDRNGRPAGKPYVKVYEKLDSEPRTKNDIALRDNIDYPFIPDERVIGEWKTVDFLSDINKFGRKERRSGLFLEKLSFEPDGKCVYTSKKSSWARKYTKGIVINEADKLACRYEIRGHDGKEYLILEWKSGDYVFGGRITWYVFEK